MNKSVVKFDANKLVDKLFADLEKEQTRRLIVYAKEEIGKIGSRIMEYNSRNHMDRTGNLLASLCWGVSFNGQLVDSGFFRESASGESYLHEWFSGDEKYMYPVDGHQLAADYLQRYGNNGARGWKVFFAILAPYWGYWENGFTMTHGFSSNGSFTGASFKRFAVMTEFYDEVKKDLKPARTRFRHPVVRYDHAKIKKRWEKYAETGR